MANQDETDTNVLVAPEGTTTEEFQQAARDWLAWRRSGNYTVTEKMLRQAFRDTKLTIEAAGTTEDELVAFLVEDCRRDVDNSLKTWRITAEPIFAQRVVHSLQQGSLKPEEFGITPEELESIRNDADLD